MQELQNKLRLSNRENINRLRDFRLMGEKEKNKYYFNDHSANHYNEKKHAYNDHI